MLRLLAFLFFAFSTAPALAGVAVNDVRIGLQEGGGTRFVLEIDQEADYRLFLLNNPPRAVIDLPGLNWSRALSPDGKGLVKGWRYGQFGNGTRIVLDLTGPAQVTQTQMIPTVDHKGRRLVLDLAGASNDDLNKLIGRSWGARAETGPVAHTEQEAVSTSVESGSQLPDSQVESKTDSQPKNAAVIKTAGIRLPPPLPETRQQMDNRPLIVIDAGHGGVDPGALAVTRMREKDLTLAVARRLATQLEATGHYRVKLTRNRDIFIPLKERVRISRDAGADLFISLHADSMGNRARDVRGATVYTLSDRASDAEAAALAESENRADELAGLEQVGGNDTLANILIDMSHRASLNQGRDFSLLVARNLRQNGIRMTDNPTRSAGFAVLKAPDVPSVLIEMGYLSSLTEARQLAQVEHQEMLVRGIVQACDSFFSRHRPQTQTLAALQ